MKPNVKMLQVMTFSIGVIESDTVSTSNMPPLPLYSKFQNHCRCAKISTFRANFFFARWVLSQSCRIGRWIRSIRSRWRGPTIYIYSWPFMTNSYLLVLVSSLSSDHDHRWPTAWYYHLKSKTKCKILFWGTSRYF